MSLESHLLFIPQTGISLLNNTTTTCTTLFFIVSVFALSLLFSPGGLAWSLSRLKAHHRRRRWAAIPGPAGLPFLGLAPAFSAGSPTHRVLADLTRSFGAKPLMSFSVGLTRFVVSSHPETAREILTGPAFADRPVKESARGLLFHRAMGFAPSGEYWRRLRQVSSARLFGPRSLARLGPVQAEAGLEMVERIKVSMERDGEVRVRKVLHLGSLKNVMTSVFGKGFEGFEGVEELVREGYDLLGVFNWSDHFPFLGFFDLQGVRKRCEKLVVRVNEFVGKIIEEHRLIRKKISGHDIDDDGFEESGDFVDVLLGLEEENKLSDSDMIAVLWEMIFRGTDTVAILLEWILARIVLHPEVQSKARSVIQSAVTVGGIGPYRPVLASDLPKLRYLKAVVKETLRLHPPGPLLSWARLSTRDTHVGPHFVPAGTTAMVNMCAITHDARVWPEPGEFRPERFASEEDDVAIMGSDLRLAPFGSGRRVCPGRAMGLAVVELWLAQLLQSFEWVPLHGRGTGDVDLSETLKLSLEMKNPLVCKIVPARVSS